MILDLNSYRVAKTPSKSADNNFREKQSSSSSQPSKNVAVMSRKESPALIKAIELAAKSSW